MLLPTTFPSATLGNPLCGGLEVHRQFRRTGAPRDDRESDDKGRYSES